MVFKKRIRKQVKRRPMRKMHKGKRTGGLSSKELVIYKNPAIEPFPSRYRCKFESSIYGSIGGTTGPAANQFVVRLNDLNLPYNAAAGGLYSAWPNALPDVTTLNPTGFLSLCNANLYNSFRVYSSTIHVEFLPESLLDTVQVSVIPVATNVQLGLPLSTIMNQPYAKSGLMSASKDDFNSKKGGSELRNSMTQHKLLGVSHQAITDDLSTNFTGAFGGTAPLKPMYWLVAYATPDGSVLTTHLKYRVRTVWHCELYDPFHGDTLE